MGVVVGAGAASPAGGGVAGGVAGDVAGGVAAGSSPPWSKLKVSVRMEPMDWRAPPWVSESS